MGPVSPAGVAARLNSNGFVAVDLDIEADPIGLTPEIIAAEKKRLPKWRFAQEYLRDWFAQVGQSVFEPEVLQAARKVRDANFRVELDEFTNPGNRSASFMRMLSTGRTRCWLDPADTPDTIPQVDGMRTTRRFGIGVDVSEGVEASDSAIEVFAADNFEEAASFNSPTITPADLGVYVAALARFYNNALVCCVRRMHGLTTLRAIIDYGRYYFLWREKMEIRVSESNTSRLGWAKGESSSPFLFGRWADALQTRGVILHDAETLRQHEQYIYDHQGRICLSKLANAPLEVRNRHADKVVACALAYLACYDSPKYNMVAVPKPKPAYGSVLWYVEQDEEQRRREEANRW